MDAVDAAWIRRGTTAMAAILAAGILFVAGLQYIAACRSADCTGAIGLPAAWAAIGAVAAGRFGWRRDAATGAAAAAVLASCALHLYVPASWKLYGPLLQMFDRLGGAAGAGGQTAMFLLYWLLVAALGAALAWQLADGLDRLAAPPREPA